MHQTWITRFRKDPVRTLDEILWSSLVVTRDDFLSIQEEITEWLTEAATPKDLEKFDHALANVIVKRFQSRDSDKLADRRHAEYCWLRTFELICSIHPDKVERTIRELQAIGKHGVNFFADLPDADTRDPLYWRFCIAAFNGNLRRLGRTVTGRQ